MAPGNRNTLDKLRQRVDVPREPIPELLRDNLDEKMFNHNVRSAKKEAAAGLSGTTCDHLRALGQQPRHTSVVRGGRDVLQGPDPTRHRGG